MQTETREEKLNNLVLLPELPCERVSDFGLEGWPTEGSMIWFWLGWEDWLRARGIAMNLQPVPNIDPRYKTWSVTPHATPGPADLPYASCAPTGNPLGRRGPIPLTRIGWAQDSAHRDVVLKLVNTDTDEYHIYCRLLKSLEKCTPSSCCGVLRPVAIINTPRNFVFVVMPRWGAVNALSDFSTVAEVMQFLRCTSKGLSFLHEHRVVHRDIQNSNMLVNCYSPDAEYPMYALDAAAEHRRTGDVHYCLMDFNISLCASLDTALDSFHRPWEESTMGVPAYHPPDLLLGEPTYNPFAYDVACLGNIYRIYFTCLVSRIPLLAPLFDKMTTHLVSRRFTALEAANFIEGIYAGLSETTLSLPTTIELEWGSWANSELYWSQTSPEFAIQWSSYRTPERTWSARFLDWFGDMPVGWSILTFTRRTLGV